MVVEFFDNGEISLSGHRTATDGIYIPLKRFAEEHDVTEMQVRVWKYRGNIQTVTILDHVFVKKDCQILLRRYTENVHKNV